MLNFKNIEAVFSAFPTPTLIFLPNAPHFTVAHVNKAFTQLTNLQENDVVGKEAIELFSQQPDTAELAEKLTNSLQKVHTAKVAEKMPVVKYRLPISGSNDVEIRYLAAENMPVLNDAGEVEFIVHSATDVTASVLESKQLKQSCGRLQKIIDMSADLICTFDEEARFVSVSAASTDILGYTPEELIGRSVFEIVRPEDYARSYDLLDMLLNGEEVFGYEKHYVHKDGRRVTISWSVRFDPVERLIYGVGRNVAPMKKVENQLVNYGQMLSNILESITDAFVAVDKNWMVTYWNKEAEHIFNKSKASIVGKNLWEVFPDAIPTKFFTEHQRAAKEQVAVHFQEYYEPINKWFEISAYPSIDGLTIYCKDITAKKQAEEEIWIANERYEKVARATNDVIFDMDVQSLKIAWNGAYKTLLGYDDKETPLNVCNAKVHPEDQERVLELVQRAIEDSKEYWMDEYRYRSADGTYKYLLVRGYLIYDDQQQAVRMIGAMQDISAQKQHELKLSELNMQLEKRAQELAASNVELEIYSTKIKNILESITDAFVAVDKNWMITYWNKEAEQLLGVSRTEMVGKNLWEVYSDASSTTFFTEYQKAMTEQVSVHFQEHYTPIDKWLDVSAYPSQDGLTIYIKDITESKKAQEQIWIAKELYEKAVKATNDVIWDMDIKTRHIKWNDAYKTVLGYDTLQTHLSSCYDHIHPEDRESALRHIDNCIHYSKESWIDEYRYRCADGSYKYVINRAYMIYDDQQQPLRMIGAIQDITARKEYEISLQEYNAQLQKRAEELAISNEQLESYSKRVEEILESITDGFIAVDKHWIVTYWNKAAEQIVGISKRELIGKKLWSLFQDAIPDSFYTEYHKSVAEGSSIQFQEYYAPLDKWFDLSVYPSRNGLSIYFKDVTAKRQAAEELRFANERYEKIAQATNDIFWTWDLQSNTFKWSDAYRKVTGYDEQETTFENWYKKTHPEDRAKVAQDLLKCAELAEEYWGDEYRYLCADGSYKYFHDRGYLIYDDQRQAYSMIGVMQDITERKQYELSLKELNLQLQKRAEELAISNEELEQFAYIVSHDLQEPLRMVTSFMAQLEKKYKSQLDEKAQQYIYFAVDGAVRMRRLIQDLLEYSRVGKKAYQVEKVDVNELMEEIMHLNRNRIEEKNAVIEWNDLPVIEASKTALLQVLQNLIGNALKYQAPGVQPRIRISAAASEQYWEFAVSDNGIGIDAEFFDKIFFIFQRLHHRNEYDGTGIGLAICKKVIEQHKGNIWVESAPGQGSTFYFTISKQL